MYDYVIVGAGSAGCVLAARLSEDRECRVLLLEAGPPDTAKEIAAPAGMIALFKGPCDWDYSTVPQRHAFDRTIYWPRGRTLGGSSSTNGTVYIRGSRVDYDAWRDGYGCTGWGFADILPYFRRAEDQGRGESAWHGVGGPLRVEDLRYRHRPNRAWVRAAQAYGLPGNDDFNAGEQDGVGFYQGTLRRGRRCSTADGYLRPAMKRANLDVETGALVTRVLTRNGRATGVRYIRAGQERQEFASGEVILCGGVINTPQLLMLSGIGPAGHLREHDIEVVADSPQVGAGLQDHPTCPMMWYTPGSRNLWEEVNARNALRWRLLGRGPMASNGVECGGFTRSRPDGLPAPDLQFHVAAAPFIDQGLTPPDQRMVTVLVTVIAVHSRGRISLRSADPGAKPAIDPAYFADERDLDVLLAGVKQARQIAERDPFARLTCGEYAPGPDVGDDDKRLREWIRRAVVTVFHPTSTCAMGSAPTAVCDPELRVRGIEGLRVVDASVLPTAPRGNPNAPTIAIAERAADLIKGVAPASGDAQAGTGAAPAAPHEPHKSTS